MCSHMKREGESMSEWISVKDKLPEPMKAVLIISKSTGIPFFDGIAIDWVRDGKFNRFKKVTHWMPLPAPPKEDDSGVDQDRGQ